LLKIHGGEGHFARVYAVECIAHKLRFAGNQAIDLIPDGPGNEAQPGASRAAWMKYSIRSLAPFNAGDDKVQLSRLIPTWHLF